MSSSQLYKDATPPTIPSDAKFEDVDISDDLIVRGDLNIASKANVTQITSIATAVTVNGVAGTITTFSASAATTATQSFVVNNTTVATTSRIYLQLVSYAGTPLTNGIPLLSVTNPTADGAFTVNIHNYGANALSGVMVINFLVL